MTLQVASNNVYSGQGVAISVTGIAQVEFLHLREALLAVSRKTFAVLQF